MKRLSLLLSAAVVVLATTSAMASGGNIVITGHDDDLHCDGFSPTTNAPCLQLSGMVNFARAGSSLPVLAFDTGSGELTNSLKSLGIPFVAVDPTVAGNVTDALFSTSTYSAFVIASDTACGGCDLTPGEEDNIFAHTAAMISFINGGGGAVALSGAYGDAPHYYSWLPDTASPFGSPPSSPYFQTSVGATNGIPAVNGDPTHTFFNLPGTAGTSSAWEVDEVCGNADSHCSGAPDGTPMTMDVLSATISGGGITSGGGTVPEPGSMTLLGTGLIGLVGAVRRKLKK